MEFTQCFGKKGNVIANSLPQFSLDIVGEIAGYVVNQMRGKTAKCLYCITTPFMTSIDDFCVDEREQIWCIVRGSAKNYIRVYDNEKEVVIHTENGEPMKLVTDHDGASIWIFYSNWKMQRYNSNRMELEVVTYNSDPMRKIISAESNQEGLIALFMSHAWQVEKRLVTYKNGTITESATFNECALIGVCNNKIYISPCRLSLLLFNIESSTVESQSFIHPSQSQCIDSTGRLFRLNPTRIVIHDTTNNNKQLADIDISKEVAGFSEAGTCKRIISHDGFVYCCWRSTIGKYCFI